VSPKFVDKSEKIKEISQSALFLFSQKGYTSTSVEQIAESAHMGKGTVYEYFNSKEEIFIRAISDWIMETLDRLDEMTGQIADPLHRFESFFKMMREIFNFKDPGTVKLFVEINQQTFTETGAFKKHRHIIKEMRSRFCRMVEDILLDGVSKKLVRPEVARDAHKIAINLMAYLDGIGIHYLISENYPELEEQVDFYIKNFISAIVTKPDR
jgi:TetR/AcrR family fatty acid metabolism transcriptional regulator